MRQYNIVGGPGWPLYVRFYTTDPAEPGRRYIAAMETDDPTALFNPFTWKRRMAYWDDRGEVYVGEGPDILVDVTFPPGKFLLSLYAREHRVTVRTLEGRVLCEVPRADTDSFRYRRFVVLGPVNLSVQLHRDQSLTTVLSGLFIDRLVPPLPSATLAPPGGAAERFAAAVSRYEQLRRQWETDPATYGGRSAEYDSVLEETEHAITTAQDITERQLVYGLQWQVHRACFDFPQAYRALARYLEAGQESPNRRETVGRLDSLATWCAKQEAWFEAALIWEAVLKLDPQSELVERLLALYERLYLGGQGREDPAGLGHALVSGLETPDWASVVLYRAALISLVRDEKEAAVAEFQRLLKEYPHAIEAQFAQEQLVHLTEGQPNR